MPLAPEAKASILADLKILTEAVEKDEITSIVAVANNTNNDFLRISCCMGVVGEIHKLIGQLEIMKGVFVALSVGTLHQQETQRGVIAVPR